MIQAVMLGSFSSFPLALSTPVRKHTEHFHSLMPCDRIFIAVIDRGTHPTPPPARGKLEFRVHMYVQLTCTLGTIHLMSFLPACLLQVSQHVRQHHHKIIVLSDTMHTPITV